MKSILQKVVGSVWFMKQGGGKECSQTEWGPSDPLRADVQSLRVFGSFLSGALHI